MRRGVANAIELTKAVPRTHEGGSLRAIGGAALFAFHARAISLAHNVNTEGRQTMKRFEINTNLRVVLRKKNEADALEEVEQLIATMMPFESDDEDNYDECGIERVEFGAPEVLKKG